MRRFYQLPPELRATVVECLVDYWRYGDESDSIAGYASVCKEWQAIVERYNFSSLRVTQLRLGEFDSMMVGSRRGLLRRIELHVSLPTYDNDPCERKETWEEKAENNMCFTRAVCGLFHSMNSWTLEEAYRGGVDLSLAISSPSDLRNANFELWQRRRWNIKDIGEKRALMPAAHADIVARLPGLQEASFDILKDRKKETRKIHFNQFAGSMTAWPLSLEKLSISSNTVSSWRQLPHEGLAEADSGVKLCEKLRSAAKHLKHLNITNVVRIREFLKPHWPNNTDDTEAFISGHLYQPAFYRLETLHISYGSIWYNTEWHKQSDDINESSDLVDFRQVVSLAAARLAYTMPALKHMTIKQRPLMYAGKHELEYKVDGTTASITWTSSFDFRPWDRTMEAWTEVARRYAGAKLKTSIVTKKWYKDGRPPHIPSLTF
ncbi:oxoglutarate iron-dependent oxygenase [Colletotrichum karsti]|uniref:Oxoglutarate iron-dependent oxygenase n=1 Tax=Colletotrichum karsti TaxID=1095194 RepID=A0A9P6I796_9PEZI|nr:oxoglutarate iron-dependent oxygenase [Colletotrichum karsti]KAF9877284.1 oxoglutarate iron-dependent oxygenase [Colletotrichum karsti]